MEEGKGGVRYFDKYELTPEYDLNWDKKKEVVTVTEKPWMVEDDNGVKSVSLLPAPVMVALIKQLADVLDL